LHDPPSRRHHAVPSDTLGRRRVSSSPCLAISSSPPPHSVTPPSGQTFIPYYDLHPSVPHCTMVCILQYLTFPFTFILLSNQSFVPCSWTDVNATPICRILSFDGPVADLASLKVTTLAESGEETLTGLKSMLRQILAGHSKGLKLTQASYSRPREIHSLFTF